MRFKDWINTNRICERCGKVMTEYYGSGRFCSRYCSNSRKHSDESKIKTSETLRSKYEYVKYGNKQITKHKLETIKKRKIDAGIRSENKKRNRNNIYNLLDISNSPYSDYDCVFVNSREDIGEYYYFTKHDEKGKIIKRALCPVYRYMVEKELGRRLKRSEIVHHIDFNHFNNDRSNLTVMSVSDHVKLHTKSRASNSAARIPDFC